MLWATASGCKRPAPTGDGPASTTTATVSGAPATVSPRNSASARATLPEWMAAPASSCGTDALSRTSDGKRDTARHRWALARAEAFGKAAGVNPGRFVLPSARVTSSGDAGAEAVRAAPRCEKETGCHWLIPVEAGTLVVNDSTGRAGVQPDAYAYPERPYLSLLTPSEYRRYVHTQRKVMEAARGFSEAHRLCKDAPDTLHYGCAEWQLARVPKGLCQPARAAPPPGGMPRDERWHFENHAAYRDCLWHVDMEGVVRVFVHPVELRVVGHQIWPSRSGKTTYLPPAS